MQPQENDTKSIGWIQHLLTTEEQIFIPFVCRQCGECCRKLSVHPNVLNPFKIAIHLNLSIREVIETYFGTITYLDNRKVQWKQTKPAKPCAFLEGNKCKIYPIRPDVCKAFPVSTDFGDHQIGCLGRKEYSKAIRKLGRGIPYYTQPYRDNKSPKLRVKVKRWKKTLQKYLSINPSKESFRIFVELNKPKVE